MSGLPEAPHPFLNEMQSQGRLGNRGGGGTDSRLLSTQQVFNKYAE